MTLQDRYNRNLINFGRIPKPTAKQRTEFLERALEHAHEAMGRIDRAGKDLVSVAESWIDGPFPSLTCTEARRMWDALDELVDREIADRFMTAHAYTDDDPEDEHMVDDSVDGVGWAPRVPASEMFEVIKELSYDLATDTLFDVE